MGSRARDHTRRLTHTAAARQASPRLSRGSVLFRGFYVRRALRLLPALAPLVAIAVRPVLVHTGAGLRHIYLGLHAHADPLMVGCLLGIFCASPFFRPRARTARAWSSLGVIGGGVLIALFVTSKFPVSYMWHGVATVTAISAALVIVTVMLPGRRWTSALEATPLVWIGRRSYGLYLWHFPIFYVLGALSLDGRLSPAPRAVAAWALAFAIAGASFRYLERPALAWKTALAARSPGAARTSVGGYRTT